MNNTVYLDYNATAPLRPEARAALLAAGEIGGNASSVHGYGRRARACIEDARASVAELVGAAPEGVTFTSGGTEANNLAIRGVEATAVITSSIEHDSVLAAAPQAARIPVDGDGVVSLEGLAALLERVPGPALVSVMAANNETGVLQPIAQLAELVHAHDGIVHCDAVQIAGKAPFDMAEAGVDLLTLSAHKIGGAAGVGALVVANDCKFEPQLRGGGQERGRRSGTENLCGIAAFGAAAKAAAEDAKNPDRLAHLRDRLEQAVKASDDGTVVYGERAERLPSTSCIGLADVSAEVQVINLDLAGVAVSAGAACSSGKVTPSHVLQAMGCDEGEAASAIRVSTGWATTPTDVDRFIAAWSEMAGRLAPERTAVAA